MKRRDFLVGAAAALAPVAGRADDRFDVVVIGGGGAGLAAAVAAAEAGAKSVAVLEKFSVLGGHTLVSTGCMSAVNPARQRAQGIEDSVDQMAREVMEAGHGENDAPLVQMLASRSTETLLWLGGLGVRWMPHVFHAIGNPTARSHMTSRDRSGRDCIVALNAKARGLGVQVFLETAATEILMDDGRVVGVRATAGGLDIDFPARAAIIATGGFSANPEMLRRWAPDIPAGLGTTADPLGTGMDGATGDGIRLGEAVGAALVGMEHVMLIPFWGGRCSDNAGEDIYLTRSGRRFVNEAANWDVVVAAIRRLPNNEMWALTDSQSVKNTTVDTKLVRGLLHTAMSLDEVADVMGVPPDRLKETVERYNRFVTAGVDEDFGKTPLPLRIDSPPFYFGLERLRVHFTCGGLRIDTSARVLGKNGRAIPGLFAAGEVTGGIHGAMRLSGDGIASAFIFGRIAGQEAAALARELGGE